MNDTLFAVDTLRLNFSSQSVFTLNLIIAAIMFGVALEMKPANFKALVNNPKPVFVGFFSQFFMLPLVTFLLILILGNLISQPVAIGLILVSVCPGGNISNFFSALAKANIELSVSLTFISTLLSVILIPFNFYFWTNLYRLQNPVNGLISINMMEVLINVFIIIVIPSTLGMFFSWKFPLLSKRLVIPAKIFSLLAFFGFIVIGVFNNLANLNRIVLFIFIIVLIHNSLALFTGFFIAKLFRMNEKNVKTITIETGIQNSGLGLSLILNPNIFPSSYPTAGMVFVAAWWGVWHIISGLFLSLFWLLRKQN